jgi:phosphocarrier protein HPr
MVRPYTKLTKKNNLAQRRWCKRKGAMLTLNRRRLVISNTLGFHLRAAGKFAGLAEGFQADVSVYCDGKQACGKSIIELTMLAAECGTAVDVEANGPDAEEALERLAELVEAGFHESD